MAKPLPLRLARFGGRLSDPLALMWDAALGVRQASFAAAPHAIGCGDASEQEDLTQSLNKSVGDHILRYLWGFHKRDINILSGFPRKRKKSS